MPPAASDRTLIITTAVFVALAGIVFAAVLLLATGQDTGGSGEAKAPVFIGLKKELTQNIREESPRYQAHPFGGDGFWLDLDAEGNLVAYVIDTPAPGRCTVKWKEQLDAYIDCNGNAVDPSELDRYPVLIGPRAGSPRNSVYVDVRARESAPAGEAGG